MRAVIPPALIAVLYLLTELFDPIGSENRSLYQWQRVLQIFTLVFGALIMPITIAVVTIQQCTADIDSNYYPILKLASKGKFWIAKAIVLTVLAVFVSFISHFLFVITGYILTAASPSLKISSENLPTWLILSLPFCQLFMFPIILVWITFFSFSKQVVASYIFCIASILLSIILIAANANELNIMIYPMLLSQILIALSYGQNLTYADLAPYWLGAFAIFSTILSLMITQRERDEDFLT